MEENNENKNSNFWMGERERGYEREVHIESRANQNLKKDINVKWKKSQMKNLDIFFFLTLKMFTSFFTCCFFSNIMEKQVQKGKANQRYHLISYFVNDLCS